MSSMLEERLNNVRVVMIIALPTATFLNVPHMSRFILASIPVENSSMRIQDGLPVYQIKFSVMNFSGCRAEADL